MDRDREVRRGAPVREDLGDAGHRDRLRLPRLRRVAALHEAAEVGRSAPRELVHVQRGLELQRGLLQGYAADLVAQPGRDAIAVGCRRDRGAELGVRCGHDVVRAAEIAAASGLAAAARAACDDDESGGGAERAERKSLRVTHQDHPQRLAIDGSRRRADRGSSAGQSARRTLSEHPPRRKASRRPAHVQRTSRCIRAPEGDAGRRGHARARARPHARL